MPISMARTILSKTPNMFDDITIKVSSTDMVDSIVNETNARLMLSRHETTKTKDYSVTSAQQIQQNQQVDNEVVGYSGACTFLPTDLTTVLKNVEAGNINFDRSCQPTPNGNDNCTVNSDDTFVKGSCTGTFFNQ